MSITRIPDKGIQLRYHIEGLFNVAGSTNVELSNHFATLIGKEKKTEISMYSNFKNLGISANKVLEIYTKRTNIYSYSDTWRITNTSGTMTSWSSTTSTAKYSWDKVTKVPYEIKGLTFIFSMQPYDGFTCSFNIKIFAKYGSAGSEVLFYDTRYDAEWIDYWDSGWKGIIKSYTTNLIKFNNMTSIPKNAILDRNMFIYRYEITNLTGDYNHSSSSYLISFQIESCKLTYTVIE